MNHRAIVRGIGVDIASGRLHPLRQFLQFRPRRNHPAEKHVFEKMRYSGGLIRLINATDPNPSLDGKDRSGMILFNNYADSVVQPGNH